MIGDLGRLPGWMEGGIVPAEVDGIIVAVVRIAFPVARQTDCIRTLIEAAIAEKFGIESTLYAAVHELVELPVQSRTDGPLDFVELHLNSRRRRWRIGSTEPSTEQNYHKPYGQKPRPAIPILQKNL